jgi:molecular chaperone DnaJ
MSKQDYYKLLDVSKSASADEIKKAFRKMAMKYHPDRNQGDAASEQKFKEVSEAYEILSDEQKKAAYDRYGHAAFENGGGGRGGQGFGGFSSSSGDFSDIFGDIFSEFMGGGGGRTQSQQRSSSVRGSDLRYNLQIRLEDAFSGASENISFTSHVKCEPCGGAGSSDKSGFADCSTCHGHGKVRMQQGFFVMEQTCPNCKGVGKIIKNPCKKCYGAGRVEKNRNLVVNVPAGVEEGTKIRLSSQGEAGIRGGVAGDLYVFISIAPHKLFTRKANNLYCNVPLKMTTAILGGSVEVPTIEGTRAKVTIPSGTQSGDQFRLRGKGMNSMNNRNRGDMYVTVQVETPVNLTKRQKELLQEFEQIADNNSSPQSEGFFSKIKDFWQEFKDKEDKD